ncbi:MAG: divalent-cation tolerance protein CutA [Nanobdellota archaeon]
MYASVYVTFRDREEADRIIKLLLDDNLIACANVFNIDSIYKWKGKVAKEGEVAAFLKTVKRNFGKIEELIKKHHSYDVPCILRFNIEGNADYTEWIDKECRTI